MMNERQKAILDKLGLDEADFEPKESVVTDEERIADLELAICELFDALASEE